MSDIALITWFLKKISGSEFLVYSVDAQSSKLSNEPSTVSIRGRRAEIFQIDASEKWREIWTLDRRELKITHNKPTGDDGPRLHRPEWLPISRHDVIKMTS